MQFYNYINSIFKNQIKEVKEDSYNSQLPIFIKENYKLSKYNILGLGMLLNEKVKYETLVNKEKLTLYNSTYIFLYIFKY